jgi:hypothetical protein
VDREPLQLADWDGELHCDLSGGSIGVGLAGLLAFVATAAVCLESVQSESTEPAASKFLVLAKVAVGREPDEIGTVLAVAHKEMNRTHAN